MDSEIYKMVLEYHRKAKEALDEMEPHPFQSVGFTVVCKKYDECSLKHDHPYCEHCGEYQ